MIPPLCDHSHLNPTFIDATGKFCIPGLAFSALSSICDCNNSSVFDQKGLPTLAKSLNDSFGRNLWKVPCLLDISGVKWPPSQAGNLHRLGG